MKKDRNMLKSTISSLEGEMKSLDDHLELNTYDLSPSNDLLPKLELEYQSHDYDQEIEEIVDDCKETLECLSNLYLTEDDLKKKNIRKIVHNDALALSDLKFSLACSKRGLINLMKQLDMGINDPEMFQAVGTFQKEIRDSIKMLYDLQTKIKAFYKDIKDELNTINAGNQEENQQSNKVSNSGLHLVDKKMINKMIEDLTNDELNNSIK